MSTTTQVICLRETGRPEDVARIEHWPLPALQPHQVLVHPLASPINPADLNVMEGTYGVCPHLPAVLGCEGVGTVAEVGGQVKHVSIGQHVVAPIQLGWWCDARVLDATAVLPVPADLPVGVAAMLAVNPPTAYRMLTDFVALQPGDWIIQNAANSGVGRCVIEIARAKGWRTINVLRRKELIPELQALGADVVLTDETPVSKQIAGKDIKLGLNAVGGESARQVAKSLAPRGTLVTYGAMAREPLRVDNGLLIFRDLRFRGFWVSDWYRHATREQIDATSTEIFALARAGKFHVPIEKSYPLAQIREALAHTTRHKRAGKILLTMK